MMHLIFAWAGDTAESIAIPGKLYMSAVLCTWDESHCRGVDKRDEQRDGYVTLSLHIRVRCLVASFSTKPNE